MKCRPRLLGGHGYLRKPWLCPWAYSFIFSTLKNCRVSDLHFFAVPDPGKNLYLNSDPDPGGIRGRGGGGKGKNDFFLSFYHVSDDS